MMGHPTGTIIMRDQYGRMKQREERHQKIRDVVGAGCFVLFIVSVESLSRYWGV